PYRKGQVLHSVFAAALLLSAHRIMAAPISLEPPTTNKFLYSICKAKKVRGITATIALLKARSFQDLIINFRVDEHYYSVECLTLLLKHYKRCDL
ncbi:hypothetical protein, partial [Pseudomonas sp. BIOMIG1BD]|uniref:hypothetical protein n=1 Tax=Pseudomonas sp. BIOMIG1BD TaxID=1758731 RepID=UPI0019D3F3FC